MSRSRTMGAGLASSTMYSNVAQLQIGDKLQGGAPLGTGYFKAKYTGRNYRTRTDGNNKNVIFCMNRMGGVGRGRSQFNVGAAGEECGWRDVPRPVLDTEHRHRPIPTPWRTPPLSLRPTGSLDPG